jgi:hypothetical protein
VHSADRFAGGTAGTGESFAANDDDDDDDDNNNNSAENSGRNYKPFNV